MSGAGQNRSAVLVSPFTSTTGGVMTIEVGAMTGDLELLTHPTTDNSGIEALIRYAGAGDLYTVAGSPVRKAGAETHRDAHQRTLKRLTTPGAVEDSNELPVDIASG